MVVLNQLHSRCLQVSFTQMLSISFVTWHRDSLTARLFISLLQDRLLLTGVMRLDMVSREEHTLCAHWFISMILYCIQIHCRAI
jgi:hypothetical protein